MSKNITFQQTVKLVSQINNRLRYRKFSEPEINHFWNKIIKLIPEIEKAKKPIQICTGCGKLNIEKIDRKYIGCCPDSKYVDITPLSFNLK
jgi:hypothetical protein